MRVPEGIGFKPIDFCCYNNSEKCDENQGGLNCYCGELAKSSNAKLPAIFEAWLKAINLSDRTPDTEAILSIMRPLFEAWGKQEGAKMYGEPDRNLRWSPISHTQQTHQAYLMLMTEIEK